MYTKDNDINTTISFCFKMMSCKKGKFPYSSFIVLTQLHEFPTPKLTNFYHLSLSLKMALFSKSPYLTAHIKIIYETG